MWLILFLIPVLVVASGVALYHRNGRREIFKMDVVQFVYAFILAPIGFIWLKSFLFYLLRRELDLHLSLTQLFIADTAYTMVFLFVYAFVVLHSMTKSMENKRFINPFYDFFKDSEGIHLWISHVGIYAGFMTLFTILSVVNAVVPVSLYINKYSFYGIFMIGIAGGVLGCVAIWLSIFKEKFWQVLKLLFGWFFFLHIIVYFWQDPKFSSNYCTYWFVFGVFWGLSGASWFFDHSNRTIGIIEKLSHKAGWSAKKKNFLLTK